MKKQLGFTIVEAVTAVLMMTIVIGGIGGWIWNIVKLAHMGFSDISGMLVLRAVGIFVPPLGAIMGFL